MAQEGLRGKFGSTHFRSICAPPNLIQNQTYLTPSGARMPVKSFLVSFFEKGWPNMFCEAGHARVCESWARTNSRGPVMEWHEVAVPRVVRMPDLLDMHIFDQKASRKTESFLYTACLRTKPCLAIQKSKKTMCFNSRPELDNMPCHIKRVIFPRAANMLPSLAPSTALQYRKYLHYQKLLKQEWFHRSTITILLERFHRIRSQGPTKSFL